MFAFFLSLVLLLAQERFPWKALGVLILCSGTYTGLQSVRAQAFESEASRAPGASAFVEWLNAEAARRGGMVVALRQPQPIAYMTRDVGYHWYYSHTTFNDIRAMVTDLGAAYVIVPGGQAFPFTKSPEFDTSFQLVHTIGGYRIYAPDPSLVRAPAAH
jgi:hypothetical protein